MWAFCIASVSYAATSSAPSKTVWNADIKAAWTKAYQTAPYTAVEYDIEEMRVPFSGVEQRVQERPGKFRARRRAIQARA